MADEEKTREDIMKELEHAGRDNCVIAYHAVIAGVIIIFGCALFATGIWQLVYYRVYPIDMDYTGYGIQDIIRGASIASIIVGMYLVAAGLISFAAVFQIFKAKGFRTAKLVMACLSVLALIIIAAYMYVVYGVRNDGWIKINLQKSWNKTLAQREEALCTLQKDLFCRGFSDSTCRLGKRECPDCPAASAFTDSCYSVIVATIAGLYLPLGVISSILAVAEVVDICLALVF